MKYLSQAKSTLITALIVCIGIRIMWWCIAPLIPYLIGGLVFVLVIGVAVFRTTKF